MYAIAYLVNYAFLISIVLVYFGHNSLVGLQHNWIEDKQGIKSCVKRENITGVLILLRDVNMMSRQNL